MLSSISRGMVLSTVTVAAGAALASTAPPAAAHAATTARVAARHHTAPRATTAGRDMRLLSRHDVPAVLRAGVTPAHTYTVTNGSDAGAGSLRAALAKVTSDNTFDEIKLPATTITLTSDELVADDPHGLLIAGAGQTKTTIAQTAATRALAVINGTPLSLSGVTISGGAASATADDNSGNGGGIEVTDGFLRLSSSTLKHNSAAFNGGGIFVAGTGSVSSGNSAAGRAVLTNVSLLSNTAVGNGGGISALGPVYADSLLAQDNTVTGSSSYGAAIDSGDLYNGSTNTTQDAVSFNGNKLTLVHNTGAEYCGAICTEGPLQVSNSVIGGKTAAQGNAATSGAGAIGAYGAADVQLSNDLIEHNSAGSYAGGLDLEYGTAELSRVALSQNDVTSETSPNSTYAGAAELFYETVSITGSQIAQNTVQGDGAGLYLDESSDVTIANSVITKNVAGRDGGGLYENSYAVAKLTKVTISHNQATSDSGGGIYMNSDDYLNGQSVTVSDNIADPQSGAADGSGGGLYTSDDQTSFDFSSSTFSGNQSAAGGAIYDYDSAGTLVGVTFKNNVASLDGYGGGLYLDDYAEVQMVGGQFAGNQATDTSGDTDSSGGGAVYVYDYSAFTATGTRFTDNTADYGGALNLDDDSGATLTNATLSGNRARSHGGAIYSDDQSNVTATGSTISGNTASGDTTGGTGGGGIENDGGVLSLTDDTIANNVVGSNTDGEYGGGIDNETDSHFIGAASLVNVTLANNSVPANAHAYGSQLATWGGATTHVQGALISGASKVCAQSVASGGSPSAGTLVGEGSDLATDSSCGLVAPGDKVAASLKLGKLGAHGGPTATIPLLKGSPARQADADCTGVATDQRGEPRPAANCDSGAYQVVVPKITKLSPASGKKGTKVTISGSGLLSTAKVTFGSASAKFAVISDGKLSVVVPAAKHAGKETVKVTTADGSAKKSFSYKK